jgi:2-polyprenyl-6-methoxyphenol hydroxylase-like FAD-dependent oxidoreductase
MLQLYGIDFVLLESNPGISPARHAGISLLPHGSRILDQLDLYDKVLELALPVKSLLHRDEIGKVVRDVRDVDRLMHER